MNLKDKQKVWDRITFGEVTQKKKEMLNKIQELDKKEASIGLSEQHRMARSKPKVNAKRLLSEKRLNGNRSSRFTPSSSISLLIATSLTTASHH